MAGSTIDKYIDKERDTYTDKKKINDYKHTREIIKKVNINK